MNITTAFPVGYISAEQYSMYFNSNGSLAPLPVARCPDWDYKNFPSGPKNWPKEATNKGCNQEGNTMRTNNEIKSYFADRAETVFYDQDRVLQKQFGLKDDATPRTAADFVARIQAGKFVLPSKDFDYGSQLIIWRDPSVVKDTAGYDIAYKALKTERTSTVDQIMQDETKALTAVDAFEAWTYTAPVATATA